MPRRLGQDATHQVQPIVAKMILPWFGGSSSVWTLCMVFFQVELLLGYAYVHLLHEKISARRQPWVHGALLLLSLATLPVVADPAWKLSAQAQPTWSVLGVLATTVGVPYLMLSTTGPLMQAWFARSFVHQGQQTYRLYALSNLASMLALLSYPVLVEPRLAVRPQAWLWSGGYVLFVLCCVATAAYTLRRQQNGNLANQRRQGDGQVRQPAQSRPANTAGRARNNAFDGVRSPSRTSVQANRGHTSQSFAQRPGASRAAGHPISRPSAPARRGAGGRR